MRRPTRLLAVAASAVLGVAGGVAGGLLVDRTHPSDPLGLDVPLVNQSCTGRALVITAWGTTQPVLASAVAEDPEHSRYLEVSRSCKTGWKRSGTRTIGYITYLGPYSTREACTVRMTAAHRGDLVIRLLRGNRQPVQCLCQLDFQSMPELTPGMVVGAKAGIFVRALQELLTSMGLNPPDHVTGLYDPQTVRQITDLQRTAALPANGRVDKATWHAILGQGCKHYSD